MTGPILGTSSPVSFVDGYNGATNFLFGTTVSVSPSATYFLDVHVQSGDDWGVVTLGDTYANGAFYGGGFPFSGADLWFREGIVVVPEPASGGLFLMAIGVFLIRRVARNQPL